MSRISLTEACANALEEARWATRAGCVGDLLASAMEGDRGALQALLERWPADTTGPRTSYTYVRSEVLEGLAELARSASEQPARGPSAPGLLGITEMLRRAGGRSQKKVRS